MDSADLFAAVDQVAEMLLARARFAGPPVDALELALRLNITGPSMPAKRSGHARNELAAALRSFCAPSRGLSDTSGPLPTKLLSKRLIVFFSLPAWQPMRCRQRCVNRRPTSLLRGY